MSDAVMTYMCYHPLRPVRCLRRALNSLDNATIRKHDVEVVVQGDLRANDILPAANEFKNINLVYYYNDKNLGNAVPLIHSVERFLDTDYEWWAKCDDDMSFPALGWDILIHTLQEEEARGEYNCGCSMMAVPMPMWSARPRIFYKVESPDGIPKLRWHERGYVTRNNGATSQWIVVDFADHGCTMFRRAVFEAGCRPDERLFVGGVDFDLCLEMLDKGFKSILTTKPRSEHWHGQCKPKEYFAIRYDPEQIRRSGGILREKWKLDIEMLTGFKGVRGYSPGLK